MNATQLLHDRGQSLWLDNITRDLLTSGTLKRYIDDFAITGLTSNPTIFDHAIRHATAYDAAIHAKSAAGQSGEALFFELALEDLTQAADLLRPAHDATGGVDGWVSLEVSPLLADDTGRTVRAAVDLHERAKRPNLFIKIPGTHEGIPAIEEAIFAGVPVNVTLLFSREQYLAAAEAYMRGIERRIAAGRDPNIGSVASIFVSRWDVAVKEKVSGAPEWSGDRDRQAHVQSLLRPADFIPLADTRQGRRATAAALVGQHGHQGSTGLGHAVHRSARRAAHDQHHAREEPARLRRSREGDQRMPTDGGDAEATVAEFVQAGVDDRALAADLQREGTESFDTSWSDLMACIASKSGVPEKGAEANRT